MSMAELPTTMMTRSPGPPTYSKLNMEIAMQSSSMLMAPGSTHAAYQQSYNIEESDNLDALLGTSPDLRNRNNRDTIFASHTLKENTKK